MTQLESKSTNAREIILAESKDIFKDVYESAGLTEPYHAVKVCYKPKDKSERIFRAFPSELSRGDIYVEMVDFEYNPLFHPRRLYKHTYRADFTAVYEKVEGNAGLSYVIPFSALELVYDFSEQGKVAPTYVPDPYANDVYDDDLDLDDASSSDAHFNTMTIRDIYCIYQNVPLSNKSWLNQLIKKGKQWQQKS
jgi:hypothetical protein